MFRHARENVKQNKMCGAVFIIFLLVFFADAEVLAAVVGNGGNNISTGHLERIENDNIRKSCSMTHWFCFGFKGSVRSFHPNRDCIKDGDCDFMIHAVRNPTDIEWSYWVKKDVVGGDVIIVSMVLSGK